MKFRKDSDQLVVITDQGILARREFPRAMIIVNTIDVLDLPKGACVHRKIYRVGSRVWDPMTAAETLIKRGDLVEVEVEGDVGGDVEGDAP